MDILKLLTQGLAHAKCSIHGCCYYYCQHTESKGAEAQCYIQ